MRLTRLVTATACLLLIPISPASSTTVSVTPDDQTYIVSGSVIHADIYEGDRIEAATCQDCHWRVLPICLSWSDTDHGNCPWLLGLCPADQQIAEVYRADAASLPPGDSPLWNFTGYTCVGPAGPITPTEVLRELTGAWHAAVNAMTYVTSPPKQTLVNLPTTVRFTSGNSIEITRDVLDGVPVTLRANAIRSISCVSVGCLRTDSRTVVFQVSGTGSIKLHSTWYATYDALGLSGLPVAGSVQQQLQVNLKVWALHRKLKVG